MIKNHILNKTSLGKKIWCILLDPDKLPIDKIGYLFSLINKSSCDYISFAEIEKDVIKTLKIKNLNL